MLPGEAMNRAFSEVTGKLEGVREGSIIAALLVGNIIKIYNRLYEKLTKKAS